MDREFLVQCAAKRVHTYVGSKQNLNSDLTNAVRIRNDVRDLVNFDNPTDAAIFVFVVTTTVSLLVTASRTVCDDD